MDSKLILWAIVSIGLLTPIWLGCQSYWAASMVIVDPYSKPEVRLSTFADSEPRSAIEHDRETQVRMGPISFKLHPRRWASGLIFCGALLIIVGTGVLAHAT